jgi:hypothetical protein
MADVDPRLSPMLAGLAAGPFVSLKLTQLFLYHSPDDPLREDTLRKSRTRSSHLIEQKPPSVARRRISRLDT